MLCYAIVAIFSACLVVLFFPGRWQPNSATKSAQGLPIRVLNSHELSLYDGNEGSKGKDASLAFVTGDFTESGLTDDVSGLNPSQVVTLFDWLLFYKRTYQSVGLVAGRFYSKSGKPTAFLLHVESLLAQGQQLKAETEAEKLHFPSCNSQWSTTRGGMVWCSTSSGGIERSWTGVPRKLFSVGSSGSRCVCVEDPLAANKDPNLQEYDGCPTYAISCSLVA
ncbi:neuferricin isoform X2 [Stigmatopora argus]